jgi:2-oxoglutarate dehydrogenase E2 component (dihydrolipoamide succinyltransferase)
MLSIKVPPLGESIVEATVSRWLKNEGDAVAAGDALVELETDKITVEVPALKAGVLSKRGRAEGDVVHVDDVLGELDETATGSASPAAGGSGSAISDTAARGLVPAPQSESVKSSPAARRIADERGVDTYCSQRTRATTTAPRRATH